ncbi:MAG: alpha/beta hydrolase family protein, partial [Polyangiaceae bacterium]
GSYVQDFANLEGYVVVATDWIGLSAHENPLSQGSNEAMSVVVQDFSKIPFITDRLQQAIVNAIVLERTMTGKIVNDPAMTISGNAGGDKVADPSRVTYYGISLGGIMGLSFMGYDPDVTRGVLGCGGGFWSTLFERSVNWKEAALLIPASYHDSLDQRLLIALAQMQFDYSDPATVAPYVLNAPLENTPKKQLLMQMGLADAQVPNISTEMIARTSGISLLDPAATSIYGMTPASGPLASALTTWDVHGTPAPPQEEQTPSDDNQVHEAIRRIPQAEQQIKTFFDTGNVVDTCGGPCVEPVPPSTPQPDGF